MLATGVGAYCILQSTAVTTLPRIQAELGTSQAAASWVMTAFLIAASVAAPVLGRLGDAYGKKRTLVFTLLLLIAGSVGAALATSISVMIVARVVQGAAGGVFPLAFGIVRDEMPARLVPVGIGLISSLMGVGFATGMVTSGPILTQFGYAWIFLLPGCVAIVAVLGLIFFVPESAAQSGEKVPVLPGILLAGWLVPLLVSVTSAPSRGWLSAWVLGLLALAVAVCLLWMHVELRVRVPLVDLRLMRRRGVWSANLVALMTGMAMYAGFTFYPQFPQAPTSTGYGFGVSVLEAGYLTLPSAVCSFLVGFVVVPFARRIGTGRVIVAGSLVTSAAGLLAACLHEEKWQLFVVAGLTGIGVGAVFACLANAIITAVPSDQTGVATGMNANIRTVGGAIGSAIAASLITAHVGSLGFPSERGYENAFMFISFSALMAAAAGLLVLDDRRRRNANGHGIDERLLLTADSRRDAP